MKPTTTFILVTLLSVPFLSSAAAFTLSTTTFQKRRCVATNENRLRWLLSSLYARNTSFIDDELLYQTKSSASYSANHVLVHAAAAVTKESNKLLGIKSIGVDYGLVRTGIAVTVGYNPSPLAIVSVVPNNMTQVATQVVQHCLSERANQIIVGLPLHKNGTEAEQSNVTRMFALELAKQSLQRLGPKVPIFLWDERYTSKEAAARAHSQDPNRYLYGTLDAEAACIILESYYEDNGVSAERVVLPLSIHSECLLVWETQQQEEEKQRRLRLESVDTSQRRLGREEQKLKSMERARKVEEELLKNGILGSGRFKKDKKKKKRDKRGTWIIPSRSESGPAATSLEL